MLPLDHFSVVDADQGSSDAEPPVDIGEMRREFRAAGDGRYVFAIPDLQIELDVDRLRREKQELKGELAVRCGLAGARTVNGDSLSVADFNLSSARARAERARQLDKLTGAGQLDWERLLEEFCQRVLTAEREGQPATLLREVPRPVEDHLDPDEGEVEFPVGEGETVPTGRVGKWIYRRDAFILEMSTGWFILALWLGIVVVLWRRLWLGHVAEQVGLESAMRWLDMFPWLDMHAGSVRALATLVLVAITGFYAFVTFRIMKANERTVTAMSEQTESATRPYVSIGLITVPNVHLFYLRVTNSGKTGARDVRLTLDRDFYQYGKRDGTNLREVTAFQEPIEQLPPGAEIVFGLAMGPQFVGDQLDSALTPPVFSITATYSYGDRTVTEVTTIDARPYRGAMHLPSPVAKELDAIKEQLEKIAQKD